MTLTSDPVISEPVVVQQSGDNPTPVWRQRMRIFAHNKLAVVSLVYLVLITAACYIVPHVVPGNQTNQALTFGTTWNARPSIHTGSAPRARGSTSSVASSTAVSTR